MLFPILQEFFKITIHTGFAIFCPFHFKGKVRIIFLCDEI